MHGGHKLEKALLKRYALNITLHAQACVLADIGNQYEGDRYVSPS